MTQIAPVEMRQRVEALQREVAQFEQYEPPTVHTFHGGMYCREVTQAAGSLVVGKVHLKDHLFVLLRGTMLVTSGDEAREMTAPAMLCSVPGTKRALYAVTDALYMTVHATTLTSVEEVEALVVEADPASPFMVGNKLKREELTCHS